MITRSLRCFLIGINIGFFNHVHQTDSMYIVSCRYSRGHPVNTYPWEAQITFWDFQNLDVRGDSCWALAVEFYRCCPIQGWEPKVKLLRSVFRLNGRWIIDFNIGAGVLFMRLRKLHQKQQKAAVYYRPQKGYHGAPRKRRTGLKKFLTKIR